MRHARVLVCLCNMVLLLILLISFSMQAGASQLTIKQTFAFACDSSGKICPNGEQPNTLIQSADGNFYGTTLLGGTGNQAAGTIFKITLTGQLTTLYTFLADQNGNFPNGANPSSLLEGNDGFLYGTAGGGAYGFGVVFKLSRTGAIQVLHSFCGLNNCRDGTGPVSLLLGADGNFYGGTFGTNTQPGTLFRVTPGGSYTLLHQFSAANEGPMVLGMTLGSDRNMYGTTLGRETVITSLFRLTLSGRVTVLQTIHYAQFPVSAPIQASNGKLYGGLSRFENQAEPGIFASSLSGSDFTNILLPSFMFGDYVGYMTSASDANLWSIISGNDLQPEVISISPNGTLLQTVTFDGVNGANPDAPLVQSSDGRFFGVTESGGTVQEGSTSGGVVFTLDAGLSKPAPALVTFNPSHGKVGSKLRIHGIHFVGATAVTFNGVTATFQVLNTGNILATVPAGATTGPIAVTNAGGTTAGKKNFTIE